VEVRLHCKGTSSTSPRMPNRGARSWPSLI
jgi:hypothetical protein